MRSIYRISRFPMLEVMRSNMRCGTVPASICFNMRFFYAIWHWAAFDEFDHLRLLFRCQFHTCGFFGFIPQFGVRVAWNDQNSRTQLRGPLGYDALSRQTTSPHDQVVALFSQKFRRSRRLGGYLRRPPKPRPWRSWRVAGICATRFKAGSEIAYGNKITCAH